MEDNQLQVAKGRSPTVIESQQSLATPSWRMAILLSLVYFNPPPHSVLLSVLQCKNCANIVDRPLMTPCSYLLCCTYMCCGGDEAEGSLLSRSSHSAPSISAGVVVYEVVGSLQSHCASCGSTLELQRMKKYLNSKCTQWLPIKTHHCTQMMECPADAPLSAEARKLATALVRWISNSSLSTSQVLSQQDR